MLKIYIIGYQGGIFIIMSLHKIIYIILGLYNILTHLSSEGLGCILTYVAYLFK